MEGWVEINEAIEILEIPLELVRKLEEEEIICPACIEEKPGRFLTAEALEELRVAKVLMEDLGVNIEGIDIILRLRRQIIQMQEMFQRVLEDLREFTRGLDR
jgi:MerR family transcriptional regulator/heat shock protein HspR